MKCIYSCMIHFDHNGQFSRYLQILDCFENINIETGFKTLEI